MLSSHSVRLYLVAESAVLGDPMRLTDNVRFIALPVKSSRSGDTLLSPVVTLGRQSPCLRWSLGGSRCCSRQLLRFQVFTSFTNGKDGEDAAMPPLCQSVHSQLPECAVRLRVHDRNRLVRVIRYACAAHDNTSPSLTCSAQDASESDVWLRVGDRVVVQGGVVTLCLIAVQLRRAIHRAAAEGVNGCGDSNSADHPIFSVLPPESACGVTHSECALSVKAWPSVSPRTRHMALGLRQTALQEVWRVFRERFVQPHTTVSRATSPPVSSAPTTATTPFQPLLANSQAAVLAVPSAQCLHNECFSDQHGMLSDAARSGTAGAMTATSPRRQDMTRAGGDSGHGRISTSSDATLDASEVEDGLHGEEEEEEAATPSHSQRVRPRVAVVLERHESVAMTAAADATVSAAQHENTTHRDSIPDVPHMCLAVTSEKGHPQTRYTETYDEKLDSALCDLESRSNAIGYQLLERGSSASVLGASEDDGLPIPPLVPGPFRRDKSNGCAGVYSPSDTHYTHNGDMSKERHVRACYNDQVPALLLHGVRRHSQVGLSQRRVDAVFVNTAGDVESVARQSWKRGRTGADGLTASATMQRQRLTAPRQGDESQEVFFRH